MKVEKVIEELTALADSLENNIDRYSINAMLLHLNTMSPYGDMDRQSREKLNGLIEYSKRVIYYAETALTLLNTSEDE